MIKNYVVEGMTCEHCKAAVEEEINELPGTQGVEVDLETGRVSVTGFAFSDADIIRAVENAGYSVKEED
ncbi:heavy-metal-associated domain-containing protein [Corynebacterium testudinoris]|uniref:Copper chaperone n=1 Tax=Corynebacterium testudinoris TaxID=136857 RepID=A0A0G3H9G4_9CORY|nr:heavy-metal-associated domain-containing protein [Corynebacterium testudinoris]AKK09944.1 copper chaperone [Corynebacterium testudinoris]MBX8995180.1 heavy-metal-associated domain-containing protein [Corynebacterium testudinoris]